MIKPKITIVDQNGDNENEDTQSIEFADIRKQAGTEIKNSG